MAVNRKLMQRTLAHIKEHPEEWHQRTWRCGAACCFAGRAALLTGWRWTEDFGSVVTKDGRSMSVADAAQRELGVYEDTGMRLFAMGNTIDDLEDIVTELCGEK